MDRLERKYKAEAQRGIKKQAKKNKIGQQLYVVKYNGKVLNAKPMSFVEAFNSAKKIGMAHKIQCQVSKVA